MAEHDRVSDSKAADDGRLFAIERIVELDDDVPTQGSPVAEHERILFPAPWLVGDNHTGPLHRQAREIDERRSETKKGPSYC
jgi:hypothetical protein